MWVMNNHWIQAQWDAIASKWTNPWCVQPHNLEQNWVKVKKRLKSIQVLVGCVHAVNLGAGLKVWKVMVPEMAFVNTWHNLHCSVYKERMVHHPHLPSLVYMR